MGATADIEGVRFHTTPTRDGTATAAYSAIQWLGDGNDTLIVYGDIATPVENLRAFRDGFAASGLAAGALLERLTHEDASDWLCTSHHNGLLGEVKGHPRGGSHRLCGVYAFRSSAFPALLRNPGLAARVDVGGMPPVESDVAGSLQVLLDDGIEVYASETVEFIVDMDKPWHVLEANARMADYLCRRMEKDEIGAGARVSDGAEIAGRLVLGRNATVGNRVVLRGNAVVGADTEITNGAILHGNFVIGSGCRIRNYCEIGGSSVVGNRCVVGHGAEFSGVLFDKVYLYHYCEMYGVFGEATDIGAATVCGTLRFDDRDTPHRIRGRLETPPFGADASYIGEFCRTGVNAILMPGVKVGSYSCVGPGVVCYEDVPSRTLLLVKQELTTRSWGPERYGW
jgi:bifunctional UDP-N-acetylglucosamine pyrophosphorylase/glucosamine-1-phosphate N-acetyltransferase